MDTERLRAIIEQIKANPSSWNQGVWHKGQSQEHPCGTAHCIAGFAELNYFSATATFVARATGLATKSNAKFWLGLSDFQAEYLFSPIRTLPEIEEFLATEGYAPWIVAVSVDYEIGTGKHFIQYACTLENGDSYSFNNLAECGELWKTEAARLLAWDYPGTEVDEFEGREYLIWKD